MKLWFLILIYSSLATAQKAKNPADVYELVGFPKPTKEETQTLFEDTYLLLQKSAQERNSENALYFSENAWLEDPFRFFYASFIDGRMEDSGDKRQSTLFTTYTPLENKSGRDIKCSMQSPPSADSDLGNKSGIDLKFSAEHRQLILANDNSTEKLESIAKNICSTYAKAMNVKNSGTNVVYENGFQGTSVIRTVRDVESLSEALPLINFSVNRNREVARDHTSQGFGSTNLGSDAMANQLEFDLIEKHNQLYDGNRFAGLWDKKSGNPYARMRGFNEGRKSTKYSEPDAGSAGVMMWELCVERSGQKDSKKPTSEPSQPKHEENKKVNLLNQNVAIELPDNIVSPFPLKVKDGVIVGADVEGAPNKNGYLFGPRVSDLSDNEQKKMLIAATAMSNKAKGFVEELIDNPAEVINLDQSSISVTSCSNFLKNGESFKNWSTEKSPASGGTTSISFEKLSNERANAQIVVINELIKKEVKNKIVDLEREKKIYEAKAIVLASDPTQAVLAKRQSNRALYLETQIAKLKTFEPTKIKVTKQDCSIGSSRGVSGPNPYFKDLKEKYKSNYEWPVFNSNNPSGYYSMAQALSSDLKRKDVEDKLKETQAALTSSTSNSIQSTLYEDLISKYKKILSKSDGSPAYLDIPLITETAPDKFPSNISEPGSLADKSVIAETRRALGAFKIEKMMADIKMNKVAVSQDVKNGYEDSSPVPVSPPSGRIFYAGVMCTRKYEDKDNEPGKTKKGKMCKSKTTGMMYPCDAGAIRQ